MPGRILLSGQRRAGDVTVSQGELGRTVFATFLVLRPGEHLETTFAYTLPQVILERTEAEVVAADPRPAQRDENVLTYDVDLRTDFQLDVTWGGWGLLGAPGVRG